MRNFLFRTIAALSLVFSVTSYADVWLTAHDITAGEDTPVRISGLFGEENVELKVKKPDNTTIPFNLAADEMGVIHTAIYGLHTQIAGTYTVTLIRPDVSETHNESFTVKPGAVSAYQSTITIDEPAIPADGIGKSTITVKASDAYGNAIPNASLQVLSSRNIDKLIVSPTTNSQGIATGSIQTRTPGVANLSAIINGVAVFERPEIIFHVAGTDASALTNVGSSGGIGSFLQAQLFDDGLASPNVAYFTIEELGEEVTKSQALNVRVAARDENNNIVPDFLGTIRFSSTDDQAVLPADYTFTPENQGVHTFFLGVTFSTPGNTTLAVHDLNDFRIYGEWTGMVKDNTVDTGEGPEEAFITIITPQDGTYRSNRQTITGDSTGCTTAQLLDTGTVMISDLPIQEDGSYAFETPVLADGTHEFQAICGNDSSVVSNIVVINIDRTPPAAMSVTVDPDGEMPPLTPFVITVGSSEPLSGATCTYLEIPRELTPTDSSNETFTADLNAPPEEGNFPIACTIYDLLGNELTEPNAGEIIVRIPEPEPLEDSDDDGIPDEEETQNPDDPEDTEPWDEDEDGIPNYLESNINDEDDDGITDEKDPIKNEPVPPTAVQNLITECYPEDDTRIWVKWNAATDDGEVASYRVRFGQTDLGNENMTPDARTQWYITDLTKDETYQFEVSAIDNEGLEGPATRVEGTVGCEVEEVLLPAAPASGPSLVSLIGIGPDYSESRDAPVLTDPETENSETEKPSATDLQANVFAEAPGATQGIPALLIILAIAYGGFMATGRLESLFEYFNRAN